MTQAQHLPDRKHHLKTLIPFSHAEGFGETASRWNQLRGNVLRNPIVPISTLKQMHVLFTTIWLHYYFMTEH